MAKKKLDRQQQRNRQDPLDAASQITKAILNVAGQIPTTDERRSKRPVDRTRIIANRAAVKAATVAGGLALPPGLLGWITILPDLIVVWRIQSQMVSDIAGAFGKRPTQEAMLFCLFRHYAAQAVRDLVARVGERMIVRRATLRTLQTVAKRIGIRVTQRAIGKGVSRWLLVVGALGVAGYAYYDTAQVAKTTIELFQRPRRKAG